MQLLRYILLGTTVAGAAGSALQAQSLSDASVEATSAPVATAHLAVAPIDTTAPIAFTIPAQRLPDALADFARQAGVRIVADGAAIRDAAASAVTGRLTAAAALRQLLAGTGFVGRFVDLETVAISRVGDTAPAAQQLGAVVVTGTAVRRGGYAAARTTTATKTDTPLRDTPQSVTVVTQELIADQAMSSMADVVRYVPGVTMGQGEGHRDAPTIRGNSSTADFYVDGVRDDVQYYRDVYNVERVEGLKGSNAMIFGRGGGGGVINRVTKEAQWPPVRAVSLTGGSYDQARGTVDVGQGLGRLVAVRLNGLFEQSNSYRDETELRRIGINPTAAISLGVRTTAKLGYEYFSDDRTVDRGIPSYQGRPSSAPRSTFFGNPDASYADARVHAAWATLEHSTGRGLSIRNRTRLADYDRFYQNVFPGAMTADGAEVNLSAYNNRMERKNLFNQTDVTLAATTGSVFHTLLVGAEFGRQGTDNARESGSFGASPMRVPFADPTTLVMPTFSRSASDADNHVDATIASVYAQDQVALTQHIQAIVGVRVERFKVDYENFNVEAGQPTQTLSRTDDMVSPRAGLVIKPVEPISFYGSYSISHLPSSGDQFSSLNATTGTLEPERFTNYEVGAKWDVRPELSLTAAAYRLDRTNTRATDPNDPSRTVQTGEQRTTGWELGVTGRPLDRWEIVGGFASQRATITSTTASAPEGRTVPLVPASTVSLWNKVRVTDRISAGVGVTHQGKSYAAIDNTVTLPAFTRADAALYLRVLGETRLQVNVENLLDETYFPTSHGNNNIQPGAPRSVRVGMVAAF